MKKVWMVLGLGVLAAGIVPYRLDIDKESRTKTLRALLWQAHTKPGDEENKRDIEITLGLCLPAFKKDAADGSLQPAEATAEEPAQPIVVPAEAKASDAQPEAAPEAETAQAPTTDTETAAN